MQLSAQKGVEKEISPVMEIHSALLNEFGMEILRGGQVETNNRECSLFIIEG